ncbi:hypothetical protein ACU4GH_01560 [Bradyrhizobium betae]
MAPPPIAIVVPSYDTTKQQDDQTKTKDADPTYKPQPPAPLPPGQGIADRSARLIAPCDDGPPDPVDRACLASGRIAAGCAMISLRTGATSGPPPPARSAASSVIRLIKFPHPACHL